jgi:hypothetical protein
MDPRGCLKKMEYSPTALDLAARSEALEEMRRCHEAAARAGESLGRAEEVLRGYRDQFVVPLERMTRPPPTPGGTPHLP